MNRFEKAHIYMKDIPMWSYHPLLDHSYTKPYENTQVFTVKCENVETDGYSIISCAYQEQDIDDQEMAVTKIENDDGDRRMETSRLLEENSITATVDTKFNVDSKDWWKNTPVENKGVEESIAEKFENEFAQKEKVIHCELREIEMNTSFLKKFAGEIEGDNKEENDDAHNADSNDSHNAENNNAHNAVKNNAHNAENNNAHNAEKDQFIRNSRKKDDVDEKSMMHVHRDYGDFESEMDTSQKCILDANECIQIEHVSIKEENIMYDDAHDAGNEEDDMCIGDASENDHVIKKEHMIYSDAGYNEDNRWNGLACEERRIKEENVTYCAHSGYNNVHEAERNKDDRYIAKTCEEEIVNDEFIMYCDDVPNEENIEGHNIRCIGNMCEEGHVNKENSKLRNGNVQYSGSNTCNLGDTHEEESVNEENARHDLRSIRKKKGDTHARCVRNSGGDEDHVRHVHIEKVIHGDTNDTGNPENDKCKGDSGHQDHIKHAHGDYVPTFNISQQLSSMKKQCPDSLQQDLKKERFTSIDEIIQNVNENELLNNLKDASDIQRCLICPKICYSREKLHHHMLEHKGKTPNYMYDCRFCMKTYLTEKSWLQHSKCHNWDPPSPPCSKPFVTDIGEEHVRLSWKPSVHPNTRKTPLWYSLEVKKMPSSNWLPLANEIKDTTYYVFGLQRDVDYYIRVHAETKVGVSEPTEPVWIPRATVFPGVPVQRPQISEIEPTKARVSWTLANFPELKQIRGVFYLLEVLIPPSKYWHTVAKEITDLSHVVTDLNPGQDYLFRVRARTILGKYSNPSPRTSLYKTLATSRAPIDGLEFEESDPNSDMIRLRWNRVDIPPYHVDEEPLFYTVEINDFSDDKWRPLVSGLPVTKYKFKAPTPKRDYKFRVRAVSQYGLSPPTPALLVTCKDSSIGSRFTYQRSYQVPDVHISHLQPESCMLSWKPVKLPHLSSPVKYQIDVKGSSDIEWRPVAIGITETSLRVNGLDPKRDYNFKVTPLTSTNYLGALPYVTLTSMQESKATYIYHKSRKVHVSDLQLWSLTLSWKRPYQLELPVKYRIDVREFPDLEWRPVAVGITETKCRVTRLNPRRNYNFQVTPLTSVGGLEPLPYVTVTSMPVRPRLPPSEPILTEITKDTVQLSWQPAEVPFFSRVKQQILYCVEMTNESLNSNWTTVTPKTSNTMCFVNELSPDLDYQFRIKAYYMDLARIHTHSRPSLVVSLYRNSDLIFSRKEPVFVGLGPDLKSVVLSWQPAVVSDPSKRASYRIEMQVPPQIGEWENIRNLQRFSTLVKMKADQDYFARVRAKIGDMITEPTLPIYVSKRTDPPIIPHEEPILSKIRSESVKLKWRSQSHVTNYYPITYRVEKQEVPNSDWTIEAYGIFSTNFHVVGLHPDEEYKFRILAESEIGISEPTPCVTLQKRLGEIADSSDSEQDGEEEGIEAKGREQHTCIEEYLDWEGNKWIIEEKQRGQNVEDSNNGEMFHGRNGDEDCDQNREENSNKVGLNRMVEKEDTCSSNKRPMDRKEKEVTSCDTKKRKPNDPEEGLIVCTEDEECSSLNEEYVNKSRMVEEDVIMHCQKEECSILYEEQARKGDRFEEAKDFEIKNPKVRKCEIVKLSLKTTHDRNVKALKDGKGEVYLLRSISSNGVKKERCEEEEDGTEKGRRDLSHYGPCPQCYGWVLLKSISRHSKSCILTSRVKFSNLELILQSNILSERIPNAASQALTEEVFSIMDKDHIYEVVCKDSSIIFLGNQLIFCNKGKKTMLPYYISSTMRLAARLKMAIQRIDKSSNDLADYFTPKKFDIVVQAALHCCNQSETDDEDLKSPSNLIKLRFDIRKMASVKYVNGQKHNDAVKRKEAEEFIKMMDQKWSSSVTKLVRDILVEHSYSRVKKLPPVEDLKKFVTYIQSHLKDLNFNDTSYNNFRRTVILALARITLFNRRSCEEVQAMRLAHYRDRKTGSDKVPEEIIGKMTKFEARLSERLEVVTIPGKISGLNIASSSKKEQAQEIGVPVILPGDVKEALQYIADPEVRRKAGIKEFNSYMFSNSRAGVFKAYDATQIVMQESAANLQAADLVRTSSMKNFMTTMFQVLCSTESEKQWVLNCIARNRRIRNLRFRKKSDFSDRIVDVVKILLIQDMGLSVEYREKRLDDIQLDKLVWDEEETTSQRESLDPQLETLDPQCKTLDPQRETLDPQCEALDLQCETLDPQCETLDPQAETVDPQPETLNMQNETLDPQQKTLDPQNETLGPQSENLNLQLEDEYIQLEEDFIPDLHEYLETEDEGEFDGKKRKIKVRWSVEEEAELKELFKEEFEKTLACPGVKQMRKKMKESELSKNGLIYKRKMDNIRKKITHMLGKLNSKSQLEDDEPN